jgi:hypothetical protein
MRDASPGLTYQLSVIADETCFHYDVVTPGNLQIGEPLTMILRASEAGRPVQQMRVRAIVSTPVHSLSNLLANAVPKTRAAREYLEVVKAGQFSKLPSAGATFEAALAELSSDKEFMSLATLVQAKKVEFRSIQHKWLEPALLGETRYRANTSRLNRVGTYHVRWELAGDSACGPIQRQEITSVVVGIGKIDRLKSEVKVKPGPRGTLTMQVKPVDEFGNFFGPGQGGFIKIDAERGKPTSPVIDLLDGTYLRTFAFKGKGEFGVKIGVGTEAWSTMGILPSKGK